LPRGNQAQGLVALLENAGTGPAGPAPDSTRLFCEAKAKLYAAIKDINHAGHALHAGDLEAAAKYNAGLLYPRRGKAKPEVAPIVATKWAASPASGGPHAGRRWLG
jgi:hypothetical protein